MKDTRTETINTRLSKKERQELKVIANHCKKSMSEIIRLGINNYKKTIISQGK